MNKEKIAAVALAAVMALASTSAIAAGDVKKGKKVFNKCKACHAIKARKKRVGPTMFGIVGRDAGTLKGFKFSKAMKASGITWDDANLNEYLKKPRKFVPKTKMSFAGLKKDADRANVIAYLKTLK
jgi:cytochrome c